MLHPIGEAPRLAPLYDVQTALPWPSMVQTCAQTIAGRSRRPDDVAGRHWDAIATNVGYRPSDVRRRVAGLVDRMVAARVSVTGLVAGRAGSLTGYVEEVAGLIEANALRILRRLED